MLTSTFDDDQSSSGSQRVQRSMSKYRLQKVLDQRGRSKQEAARALALRREQLEAARAELRQRQEAVAACQAQHDAALARMLDEAGGGMEAKDMIAYRTHLSDLRRLKEELAERVEQQLAVTALAEREVEKAISGLIEATKEVKVIEKHRGNWEQTTRREQERRQQKSSDEIGAVIYERGRK
jgi:flagellar export protein FliJ